MPALKYKDPADGLWKYLPSGEQGVGVPNGGVPGQVLGKIGTGDFETAWIDTGEVSALDDLTDVDTNTAPPTDGQGLLYDESAGLWLPGNMVTALDDLADVDATGAAAKDTLAYSGASWGVGPGFTVSDTAPGAGDGKDGDWWAVTGESFTSYPTGIGLIVQSGFTITSQVAMRAGNVVTLSFNCTRTGNWTSNVNQVPALFPAEFYPQTRVDLSGIGIGANVFFPVQVICQTSGGLQIVCALGASVVTTIGATITYRAVGPF